MERRDVLASGAFLGVAALTSGGTMLARAAQREVPVNQQQLFDKLPGAVGRWRHVPPRDGMIDPVVTDPAFEEALTIYDRIVARDYVAPALPRIMVNIAYKRRMTQDDRFHWPEACYEVQGFAVERFAPIETQLGGEPVGVARFLGRRAERTELVHYLIRVGPSAPAGSFGARKLVLSENLALRVPDGTMLRVSVLLPNADQPTLDLGSQTLLAFVSGLYASSSPPLRALIA